MDQLIGKEIDNYKILEVIGRGGMGVVFKAMDTSLEKIVALKMIDPFLARDENFLQRFKTEARALARLESANIVGVHALRETSYGLFMVMEYVQAKTISEWLHEKGKFTSAETIMIGKQIINAIGHAHKVGVIHRDIKPNNILLGEDKNVKVMDFGLAKVVQEGGSQMTVTHAAAGTLYYMSPEQIKGLKNVDKRSDIYSIGMTLYEMLAGRTPFDKGESEFVIQKQIVEGKIPPPAKYNPLIPKDLIRFIMKSIDKDPEKRFQDTTEMMLSIADIKSEVEEEKEEKTRIITAYDKKPTVEISPTPGRNRIYVYAGAVAIFILLIVGYWLLSSNNKKESPVNQEGKVIKKVVTVIPANLVIKSEPSYATVYIDGKPVGKTPLSRDSLSVERHSITLKLKGYEDWQDADYMMTSGLNELNITLNPSKISATADLTLNSVPEASIFIDGKLVLKNSAETIRNTVSTGKHTVKFVHPQFGSKEVPVNLSRGQVKQLTCYFQQQVNIQSLNNAGDPFWGMIYLNGTNTDKSTPGDLMLGPGTYKISVKKTGYRTVENDIELIVTPSLEKKTHSLVFHFR